MNIRKTCACLCVFLFLTSVAATAFEVTSLNLHLYLSGLKDAKEPAIVEGFLVLSAKGPYRYVGAAFSHENWQSVHSFELNRNNVFVLAIPLPYGAATTIRYRMVLDGLWTADPKNPHTERDVSSGVTMSVANFPERPTTVLGVWEPAGVGCATFYFEGEPGQRVTVAGSFNGWDPFIHDLTEIAPGRYELKLDLPPGEYYYVFVYKGERISDPLNKRLGSGQGGQIVSVLTIRSE